MKNLIKNERGAVSESVLLLIIMVTIILLLVCVIVGTIPLSGEIWVARDKSPFHTQHLALVIHNEGGWVQYEAAGVTNELAGSAFRQSFVYLKRGK